MGAKAESGGFSVRCFCVYCVFERGKFLAVVVLSRQFFDMRLCGAVQGAEVTKPLQKTSGFLR